MGKRNHSPSPSPVKSKDAPRKRPRMTGSSGKGFAERIKRSIAPEPIVIPNSSDEEASASEIHGESMSQRNMSPISDSSADNPISPTRKSQSGRSRAEDLANSYAPGNPDFGSEVEAEKLAGTPSKKETSKGRNYATQCIAGAKAELNKKTLEHEEVSKRMVQDEIKLRSWEKKFMVLRKSYECLKTLGSN